MKRAGSIWRASWRIALCLVLLAWVFHSIFLQESSAAYERSGRDWHQLGRAEQWRAAWEYGPTEMWKTISLLRPVPGLLSLVFMGATVALGMLRWRMILAAQGIPLPIGRAASISLTAHFFNAMLLGSTGGDLAKAYYASRETQERKTEAVVSVVVDRILGLLSMLLFAALMMVPNLKMLTAHRRLAAVASFTLMMLLAGGAITSLSLKGGLSRWFPNAREWLRRLPKAEALERALEASRQLGHRRGLLVKVFGISMILNVACVLQIWSLSSGLGLFIDPVALFLIVPTVICISALPITPNGLGVRENLYVAMLAVPEVGIPAKAALSLSLLAYAGSLFWSVVGGAVYAGLRRGDRVPTAPLAQRG